MSPKDAKNFRKDFPFLGGGGERSRGKGRPGKRVNKARPQPKKASQEAALKG